MTWCQPDLSCDQLALTQEPQSYTVSAQQAGFKAPSLPSISEFLASKIPIGNYTYLLCTLTEANSNQEDSVVDTSSNQVVGTAISVN